MNETDTAEWWRWELYRHVAHFVHNPGDFTQAKLTALIEEFRRFSQGQGPGPALDEHEYVMDFR